MKFSLFFNSQILDEKIEYDLCLDSFSAAGFFLPPKEDFFSFDEDSPFVNGRYWKEACRWESSLSRMRDSCQ